MIHKPLTTKEKRLTTLLHASAAPARMRILKYLMTMYFASVGAISENIGYTYKTTSKHLAVLVHVGYIESVTQGQHRNYALKKNLSPIMKSVLKLIASS
jgi:DNA-binding transcriptional ArsR family regulator